MYEFGNHILYKSLNTNNAHLNVIFILLCLFYQPMIKFYFLFRGIIATGVSEIFVVRNVSFYIDMKEHICGVCYECD